MNNFIIRMNAAMHLERISIENLLKTADLSNGVLYLTATQIAVFEIFKTLGLPCEFQIQPSNGIIADAYAKEKLSLHHALLLAHDLDKKRSNRYKKIVKHTNGSSDDQLVFERMNESFFIPTMKDMPLVCF